MSENDHDTEMEGDPLIREVRVRKEREHRWRMEGDGPVVHRLAQIGVLGWLIVTPMLIGVFLGRWLDQKLDTGIFWTAPLLMVGLALGCWSAWRWINNA